MKIITEDDQAIGRRIQAARKARGLSMLDIAAKIIVSNQQMQKYEAGTNRIAASKLATIARYFDMSSDELLGLDLMARPQHDLSVDAVSVARAFSRVPDGPVKTALRKLIFAEAAVANIESHASKVRLPA